MSNLLSFVLSSSRDGCFRQSTEVKNESQHGPCAGRNGESGVFCNKMCSCTPTSSPVVSSAVGGCCLGGRYDVIHRSSPDHRETDGEQPQRTEENLTASLLSSNTSGKEKKTKKQPPSSGFGSAESCRGGLCQPARRGGCWMRASCRGSTGRGCCWWTWLSLSLSSPHHHHHHFLLPITTPPSAVINHRGSGVVSPTAAPTSSVWRWPALRLRRWHPSARAVAFSPTMRAARPLRISTLVGPPLPAPDHVITSEASRVNLCVVLLWFIFIFFYTYICRQTDFWRVFLGGDGPRPLTDLLGSEFPGFPHSL